jgi:hypothetical protein
MPWFMPGRTWSTRGAYSGTVEFSRGFEEESCRRYDEMKETGRVFLPEMRTLLGKARNLEVQL